MRDDTDTYITTVPSFFKCPISLDVMRSPVSLCTGVTYDRANIQRWLDGGNNTCPATMQVLKSREVVPNLTLQRLIDVWFHSIGRRSFDSPAEKPPEDRVPTLEEAKDGLEKLNLEIDDEIRLEMLSRIVRFARESEANRGYLVRKEDFVPMLLDIIVSVHDGARTITRFELVLRAIRILDTIRSGNGGDRERLSKLMLSRSGGVCLTVILLALQRGNLESKIESVRVLEWIAFDAQSKLAIAEREGFLPELMKTISTDSDSSLIEATLSFLITISSSKRVRSRLISAKAIAKLRDLLLTETVTGTVGVTEKTLKLLEILSSRREGRSEICGGGGGCVDGVVRKLLKVSTAATEHAVAILWLVCYVFGAESSPAAAEAVERSNGVAKLLVVMQSNCSPAIQQMAKDLIKVMKLKNRTSCFVAYNTKTTHIMPF
ncbi:PREDICTED: U-box domain-containing protein 29 [Tarenaya hassleriana]|uniref:U-box domain-containing protein 29 n=1 Tax=Tarenaya hassleriana TaxID=28532 RepID=UPI00053C3F77|nr:PREDICTED: U-box domain-containing protein 29 [Tarenaya hassleriana]